MVLVSGATRRTLRVLPGEGNGFGLMLAPVADRGALELYLLD